jgi:hypothetical protein
MGKNLHQREYASKINRGEPIEICGLTLYPLTMENYEEFYALQHTLNVRLSALPVQYMQYDYLNALWHMDCDRQKSESGEKSVSMVSGLFHLFLLALRISPENIKNSLSFSQTNDGSIDSLLVCQNDTILSIRSVDFSSKIRPVMAAQNGVELPDESANVDLIQAGVEKKAFHANGSDDISFDIAKLISSVAYQSHVREKEIYSWTIREFTNRKDAIDRDKCYTIYATAEMSGFVKFKKGNPFPSWCFDKKQDPTGAMSIQEVQKRFGNAQEKT